LTAELVGEYAQVGPHDCPSGKFGGSQHFIEGAAGKEIAVREIGSAVTTLRFVHVMRRDEDR
jgi:hypothetical protein